MKAESGFIQPFTFLGIELWIDENDRLMLSVPNSSRKRN